MSKNNKGKEKVNKNKEVEVMNNKEKEMKNNEEVPVWLRGDEYPANKMTEKKAKQLSEKIVKINSSVWSIKLITFTHEYNFELSHKQNKKGTIKVKIQGSGIDTYKVKFKESKNLEYSTVRVINNKGEEKEEKYEHDFIMIKDEIIPFDILLSPLFDFYFENKKLKRKMINYTDGNIKINGDKITLDTIIRKVGYPIDPRGLSVEGLEEFAKEDDDNKLGILMEYARRYQLNSDFEEEIKDMHLADQIIAVIEDSNPKLKEALMDDDIKCKLSIIKNEMLRNEKAKQRIINILEDKANQDKWVQLERLGININQAKLLLNPQEDNRDIYERFFIENKELINKTINEPDTNIVRQGVQIAKLLMSHTDISKDILVSLFKDYTNPWVKLIWDESKPNEKMVERVVYHVTNIAFS